MRTVFTYIAVLLAGVISLAMYIVLGGALILAAYRTVIGISHLIDRILTSIGNLV